METDDLPLELVQKVHVHVAHIIHEIIIYWKNRLFTECRNKFDFHKHSYQKMYSTLAFSTVHTISLALSPKGT